MITTLTVALVMYYVVVVLNCWLSRLLYDNCIKLYVKHMYV